MKLTKSIASTHLASMFLIVSVFQSCKTRKFGDENIVAKTKEANIEFQNLKLKLLSDGKFLHISENCSDNKISLHLSEINETIEKEFSSGGIVSNITALKASYSILKKEIETESLQNPQAKSIEIRKMLLEETVQQVKSKEALLSELNDIEKELNVVLLSAGMNACYDFKREDTLASGKLVRVKAFDFLASFYKEKLKQKSNLIASQVAKPQQKKEEEKESEFLEFNDGVDIDLVTGNTPIQLPSEDLKLAGLRVVLNQAFNLKTQSFGPKVFQQGKIIQASTIVPDRPFCSFRVSSVTYKPKDNKIYPWQMIPMSGSAIKMRLNFKIDDNLYRAVFSNMQLPDTGKGCAGEGGWSFNELNPLPKFLQQTQNFRCYQLQCGYLKSKVAASRPFGPKHLQKPSFSEVQEKHFAVDKDFENTELLQLVKPQPISLSTVANIMGLTLDESILSGKMKLYKFPKGRKLTIQELFGIDEN